MHLPALLCSLPVALIGAYYLVNAGAVGWLGGLEGGSANRVRVRLRRTNGIVMLLLGVALYLGIARVFGRGSQRVGIVAPVAWISILPLLLMMLILAWLDMRLTRKLKRDLLRKAAAMDKTKNIDTSGSLPRGAVRGLALLLSAVLAGSATSGCDQTDAAQPSTRRSPGTRPTTRATDLPRKGEEEPQQLRQVEMLLGEQIFIMQVADTDEERQAGLMFRKSLEPNEGMIFIFGEEEWQSFWMKNTFVPLDVAYVDEDGRVLNIEPMAAHDLRGSDSAGPAKYVIELPLGAAEKAKFKAGMIVKIPENAREPAE